MTEKRKTITLPNGSKYIGELKDGVPHGQGTQTFPDLPIKYEGEFKDGVPHGHGIRIYGDGRKYEGEFKSGEPNGHGIRIYGDGSKYEGEFKDGEPDGQGRLLNAIDGTMMYEGEFKDARRHGQGPLTYLMQDMYWGKFKPRGQDTITIAAAQDTQAFHDLPIKYEGEVKDGVPHGHGIRIYGDGRKYEGEFKYGEPDGQGRLLNAIDGTMYEGEFEYGLPHGHGIRIHGDGRKYEGEWEVGWLRGHKFTEVVSRTGVSKESGYLYYLGKDGNVWRSKLPHAGGDGNGEKVVDAGVLRESGYLYFIDENGDVSRSRSILGDLPF